jgi:hypothetical protein
VALSKKKRSFHGTVARITGMLFLVELDGLLKGHKPGGIARLNCVQKIL